MNKRKIFIRSCSTLMFMGIILLFIVSDSIAQKRILVLSWNVESGDNESSTIEDQLKQFEGCDIIGLCEVNKNNAEKYAEAVKFGEGAKGKTPKFDHRLSESGSGDRMMIIWDERRFKLQGDLVELDNLNDGNHRSPFVAKFKLKGSNEIFLFMVNHLARVNSSLRQSQATGLKNWVGNQSLPVIAVGDYNFDFNIDDGEGNQAMENMLASGLFEWIRPSELYKTNTNPKYNGILDFIFIANKPDHWELDSRVILDGEGFSFPDDDKKSDHRPVQARILVNE
jgi:endonuclease/exonuclease/phosphatase family metal-dependent hydrolase